MAEQCTEAQLKAMYPSSPRMWPSLVPAQELSTYLPRRRAQLQYPASPDRWSKERDLDAMSAHLEPLVNAAIEGINADLRELDAAIAANSTTE